MGLDVRLPIGLLFSAIGAALLLYGLFSEPVLYARSLGVNVNLWWGLVLLIFGVTMLLLGWRAPAAAKRTTQAGASRKEPIAR